jgi:glycosyltransferase involved in cell wall biosynthesis
MAAPSRPGAENHPDNRQRVLLVAYYFPPAGGPAVQRILQFVEYLSAYGWQPTVLTVRQGAYPNRDPSLLGAVPSSVEVRRTASLDPLALYARLTASRGDKERGALPAGSLGGDPSWIEHLARWIRANVFIPDARIGWWPFAVAAGRRLLHDHAFDMILSSGAPHSVHLIGRSLHRATGVPWVADLHDPWTDISYYDEFPHTDWARRLDARLERSVLADASAVTTVSPSWVELFRGKAANRYAVIENGFDAAAFADTPEPLDDSFVLAHIGKLYASRNPTALWEALAALRAEKAIPHLRVRLIGTVDPVVRRSIVQHRLEPVVSIEPFVPHDEAIRQMARSTLLLLTIEPFAQARGMITSKLYEYLASGRPVLGIGPPDGDANAVLQNAEAGRVVSWSDAHAAADMVRAHYDAWAAGSPRAGASFGAIQHHNRQHQAERMARLFDELLAQVPSTVGE